MEYLPIKKLYHGSPVLFEKFNTDGLGFDDGKMAVTAGYYFTDNLNEALTYSGENGYIYEIDLKQTFEYKTNKDVEWIDANNGKRIIRLNSYNDVSSDLHFNLTSSQISSIIKKSNNYIDKLLNFEYFDINNKFEIQKVLKKVSSNYKEYYFKNDNNLLHGINVLGNDWFSDSAEEMNEFNILISEKLNITCFAKEISDDTNNYIFLNSDLIPSLKIYKAKDLIKEISNKNKVKKNKL